MERERRFSDVGSGMDVLEVAMYSKRKTCLGCMFTLVELKLRCAAEGIDLRLQFMGEVDPANINIDDYKDTFVEKMENLIDKKKEELPVKRFRAILDQFVRLTTPEQRFEWLQRFLSMPCTALPSAIVLQGHFP
ncbi:MAG: hypothetical protein Q6365_017525 [Candidatus Sigynarchaeota archaeon]